MSDRDRPDEFDNADDYQRAPWPIETPEDVYALRDWVDEYAPDWMDGLHYNIMGALDYYDVPPVDDWDRAIIHHGPDADDHWIIEIETADGSYEVDLGDDWDAAWAFFSWIDAHDIDTEKDVEY